MGWGGGAEEVWRDGEEKGGSRQVYDWQGKRKAQKKRRFTLTFFFYGFENLGGFVVEVL